MVVDEVVIDVADVAAVVNVVVVADVVVVVAVVAVAVVAVDDLGAPTPQPNNRAIISSNVLANFHNDKCSRSNFFLLFNVFPQRTISFRNPSDPLVHGAWRIAD